MFAILSGVICTLTGVLGFMAVKFKYSKYYWAFSCPYIIFATACGVFLIIISILTSGFGGYVKRVSQEACESTLDNGQTVTERIT